LVGYPAFFATFDFNDFIEQAKMVQDMGGAASMISMLPGMGGGISKEQIAAAEVRMKGHEALINSMTKRERLNPNLLITDKSSRSRQVSP
jgi:signal recognition particle subunit SRP54